MSLLNSLKGKTVTVRAKWWGTFKGVLVDFDDNFIVIQTKKGTLYFIRIHDVVSIKTEGH